jgi:hypothetical protein
MKSFIRLILLILITFLISCQEPEANCIPGKNCPYNQGECTEDQCTCKDGFFTLLNKNKEPVDQIFCNYRQISMKLMLLFEVLIPGSGQLYSRQWIFGGIKLGLFLSFLIISFYIKKQILIPKCCIIVKKALLGGDKDDKKDDKKEDKKDDKKEIVNDNQNEIVEVNGSNQPNEQKKQNKDPTNTEGLINDCLAFESLSEGLLVFGSKNKSFNSCFKKFMEVLLYIFWIVYTVDIYLIFFKIYPDGNGIPYAD